MTTSQRILCTGNPNDRGIAQALKSVFPDTEFVSRSTGFDLSTNEGLSKFEDKIKSFNVFVNVSQVVPGTQEKLLRLTHKHWTTGHVFNIGSVAEYSRWADFDPPYSAEKLSLREAGLELSSELFKTTHMIVGGFQDSSDDSDRKMDPIHIVNAIKWVLESEIDIPIIGLERLSDHKNYWKGKSSNESS